MHRICCCSLINRLFLISIIVFVKNLTCEISFALLHLLQREKESSHPTKFLSLKKMEFSLKCATHGCIAEHAGNYITSTFTELFCFK